MFKDDLSLQSAGDFVFLDENMVVDSTASLGAQFESLFVFYSSKHAAKLSGLYLKSGHVEAASVKATIKNGYAQFNSTTSISLESPLWVTIGSYSGFVYQPTALGYDMNQPVSPYDKAYVLLTSNNSIPVDVEVVLTDSQNSFVGERVDQFNILFSGPFTAQQGAYSL